ncbi:MAG: response regulator [Brevundimonas sp.]|nr:response regulator [Brevundimonas sp.]
MSPIATGPEARPAVLLVDDDPAVAHAVQFSFDLEGLDVRSFSDAAGLLASDLPVEGCLVLDYHLPDIDGLDLLEQLRANGVRLPAVLMTTNPRMIVKARAAAAGVPIIEKPLLTDALLTAVRSALARAGKAKASEACGAPDEAVPAGNEQGAAGDHDADGGQTGSGGGDAQQAVGSGRTAHAGGPGHVFGGGEAGRARRDREQRTENDQVKAERAGFGAVASVHGGLQTPSRA